MRLLLDTNAILAVLGDARPLRANIELLLNDPGNEKVVSVVSFWEMTIKTSLGKLHTAQPPETVWRNFEQRFIATILPIHADHLRRLSVLPHHHRDPFDRLIVAQTFQEGCTLISSDGRLDAYGIERLW